MDKQLPLESDYLPEEFTSLAEAGAFWDTHSTADYEDFMEDVALLSAWEAKQYLTNRARRGDWNRFQALLDKVPNSEPAEEDRLQN